MTMPVSVVVDQNDNSVYINVGGHPDPDTTSGGVGVTLVTAEGRQLVRYAEQPG